MDDGRAPSRDRVRRERRAARCRVCPHRNRLASLPALDLLAWDLFLGLALLLACTVFTRDTELEAIVRVGLMLSGALCVVGFIGPLTGEMRVQFLGIAGYAFVLPATCALMALLFSRAAPQKTHCI